MKTPHKHAALIKAWADGADIERQTSSGVWITPIAIDWSWPEGRYRIKPEPKPEVIKYAHIRYSNRSTLFENPGCTQHSSDNIRLVFDGDTGKLKSAEVLK